MVNVYSIKNKYLYEILDDYKTLNNKEEIFQCFMNGIWNCSNSRQIYTKFITFTMLPELVNTNTGQIFYNYVNIPYIASKTMTTNKDYINLIRQKINNIYNNYCEKRLCTRKDYMDLLHVPKQLYYRWEKNNKDECINNLQDKIEESISKAEELKNQYSKQKMDLAWKQYKPIVEEIIHKAFNNYISLDKYENKNEFVLDTDLWTEDNFCIKYICRCLQTAIKNYQKKYYGLYIKGSKDKVKYKRCINCGRQILVDSKDNQTVRCDECQHKYRRKYKTQKDIERYWRRKNEISDSTN